MRSTQFCGRYERSGKGKREAGSRKRGDLKPSAEEMASQESKCELDDFSSAGVVVLNVESVLAGRVVHQCDRRVSRERACDEPIDRVLHLRNLVASGSSDEQWRHGIFV